MKPLANISHRFTKSKGRARLSIYENGEVYITIWASTGRLRRRPHHKWTVSSKDGRTLRLKVVGERKYRVVNDGSYLISDSRCVTLTKRIHEWLQKAMFVTIPEKFLLGT